MSILCCCCWAWPPLVGLENVTIQSKTQLVCTNLVGAKLEISNHKNWLDFILSFIIKDDDQNHEKIVSDLFIKKDGPFFGFCIKGKFLVLEKIRTDPFNNWIP